MPRSAIGRVLRLPEAGGTFEEYTLSDLEPLRARSGARFASRIAFAAAHVVIDPLATLDPMRDAAIDMEETLNGRRYLWDLGFGVAEAMDTAQRGMGLDWPHAKELIRECCAEAPAHHARVACGANTDQLPAEGATSLEQITAAYQEQCEYIERCGGQIILMASRWLARCAKTPDDYLRIYGKLLRQVEEPVILHWLGAAFDPALETYWGGADMAESMAVCLALIREHASKIDGIKISLLDKEREVEMRRQLPPSVRMYTGDDFHYPELMEGDEVGYSDALLGIFDGIAPAAALALEQLDAGNRQVYRELLTPTLALSRHIFQPPTYYYKTGLVFLAFLNGRQKHFRMLGGQESARSVIHLVQLFKLAAEARLISDPEGASHRMRQFLAICGVT